MGRGMNGWIEDVIAGLGLSYTNQKDIALIDQYQKFMLMIKP